MIGGDLLHDGPTSPQFLRQHTPGDIGSGQQDALASHVLQEWNQGLGHILLRNHIGVGSTFG